MNTASNGTPKLYRAEHWPTLVIVDGRVKRVEHLTGTLNAQIGWQRVGQERVW